MTIALACEPRIGSIHHIPFVRGEVYPGKNGKSVKLWGGRRTPDFGYGHSSTKVRLAFVPRGDYGHNLVIVSKRGENRIAGTGKEEGYPEYTARLHWWSPIRRRVQEVYPDLGYGW